MEPWQIVPAFTAERLRILAELLVTVRRTALGGHAPSEGDTNWGLGCRVYERTCHAIQEACKRHHWLTVLEQPLHFVFQVDGVPLRFGRGDPDEPNPRLLRRKPNEEIAQQRAFESLTNDPTIFEWRWRLIVETEEDTLEASSVFLVQASSDGSVGNQWEIAREGKLVSAGRRTPKAPYQQAPPSVAARPHSATRTAG